MKSGVDLSRFKKLSEDDKSATFQHPDGHKIMIAKHVLSSGMKNQISKLPMHLDEGTTQGPIPSPDEDQANSQPQPTSQPTTVINIGQPQAPQAPVPPTAAPAVQTAQANPPQYVPDSEKEAEAIKNEPTYSPAPQAPAEVSAPVQPVQPSQAPSPSSQPQNSTPAPASNASDPYGAQAYATNFKRGVGEQIGGINKEAQAQGQLGQTEAELYGQNANTQQQISNTYQNNFQKLDQERQSFQQDVQNQHIDPQHYLNSMGTGSRIATGIGLLLGGMGGGLTHQGNPALDFLEKQIQNDIGAQQMNLGKSENLLSANMRQFGNLHDATAMTTIMQGDIIKNKIAQAAAQSSDPLAKARAQQAIGEIDQRTAPIMSQLAMRQTLSQQSSQPNTSGGGMDPARQVQLMKMSGIISPQDASQADKEVGILTARSKAIQAAEDITKQSTQLQTLGSRVGSPIQSSQKLDVLSARLVPLIQDMAPSKRLTPEVVQKEINPYLVTFLTGKGTADYKLGQLKQYIMNQSEDTPLLRGLGIGEAPVRRANEQPPVRR